MFEAGRADAVCGLDSSSCPIPGHDGIRQFKNVNSDKQRNDLSTWVKKFPRELQGSFTVCKCVAWPAEIKKRLPSHRQVGRYDIFEAVISAQGKALVEPFMGRDHSTSGELRVAEIPVGLRLQLPRPSLAGKIERTLVLAETGLDVTARKMNPAL